MELYKETPSIHTGFATEVVTGKFRNDADGYLDLAMAIEPGTGDEGLMVLVNNGPAGMTLQAWDTDGGKRSWGLASGWFRPSAGVQDVVMPATAGAPPTARGYFSKNDGAPNFDVNPDEGHPASPFVATHSVASALLNDDANVDFVFTSPGPQQSAPETRGIALMISNGDPTLPEFTFYPLPSEPMVKFLKAVDLNQDCRPDIVPTHGAGFVLHKNDLSPPSGVDCQ